MILEEDIYLEHYGVKGMKWGVRKERYRANRQARRAKKAEKYLVKASVLQTKISALQNVDVRPYSRAGKKNRNKIADLQDQKRTAVLNAKAKSEGKLTPAQKKVAKGAAYLAGAIAVGVGYHTIQSGNGRRILEKGKDFMKDKHDPGWKFDRSLADPMTSDSIMERVVKDINPGYGSPGTKVNCRRATFAYEMRRRGYDVRATKTTNGVGQTAAGNFSALNITDDDLPTSIPGTIAGLARKGKRETLNEVLTSKQWGEHKLEPSSIFKDLAKQPNGARGELGMKWSMGGGHSMAWEIVGGKPVIFDTQNGKRYSSQFDLAELALNMEEAGFTRLDNATIDSNFLMRWVRNND